MYFTREGEFILKKLLVLLGIIFISLMPLEAVGARAATSYQTPNFYPFKCGEKSSYEEQIFLCEKEPNNQLNLANAIVVNENFMGALGQDDIDYFKMTVNKSGKVELFSTHTDGLELGMNLFDGKNNLIEPVDRFELEDSNTTVLSYEVVPGVYFISITDLHNSGEDHIYIFSPFMQNELPINVEPEFEFDDIAPEKPKVSIVDDNDTVIKGTAEPGALIMAEVNDLYIAQDVDVAANGSFSFKIKPLKAGTTIKVWAQDTQGNQSEVTTLKVLDKTAPKTLVVNKVTSKSKTVTGKTEANATVEVKLGTKLLGKATADAKGNYKVTIKQQKKGAKLTVIAKDKAKNVKSVSAIVK
jgi:hypothetical protein